MNYDIRLQVEYSYAPPAVGGRHLLRVTPLTAPTGQRLVASSIVLDPVPVERSDSHDFFGNSVVSIAYRNAHDGLKLGMSARVHVDPPPAMLDISPDPATFRRELSGVLSLAPDSPHHFGGESPRVALSAEITAYARESLANASTIRGIVRDLGERIHRDFSYDKESTEVGTSPAEAFMLRRGVCQDFSHVMIAGLRGIGIPASYVSGYLRTIPPPGAERLVGADAMHAWVGAWCGNDTGWVGYDPTNATFVSESHIAVAIGRDYQDVTPIAGVLTASGKQRTSLKVDVMPVEG
ncbi:MAG: transglutaminase family protein [Bauldia sp.]|nr:transglutaminase family protein [Bauldia sp.]